MANQPLYTQTPTERAALLRETQQAYAAFQAKNRKLNMARGKPAPEQLDLTMPMMNVLQADADLRTEAGDDCRNYGLLGGIPEAKSLFASLIGVSPEELFIGGNSSLELMFACIQIAYVRGIAGCPPWHTLDRVRFLCPVPGYDRHFAVTEYFGIEMLPVPMTQDGPDMDMVQQLVESDASVKGIWCVPIYSNPTGVVFSDETVRRFAALRPAAADFRVFWDNAYCIHHLTDTPRQPLRITDACRETGASDMVYQFLSTSKITFSGAGVAAMQTSRTNLEQLQKLLGIQTIGFDKVNQLRHVRYFRDADGVRAHMELHRAILKPKFDTVLDTLETTLRPLGLGNWSKPEGGYFISFDAPKGCAKRIVALCKEAGVTLTDAGATFPYHHDPDDANIRIAPTYPSLAELQQAIELFCICVKLAALEQCDDLPR